MDQIACYCNAGIRGVLILPPHDHNEEQLYTQTMELNPNNPELVELLNRRLILRDSVHIWVDWKEVARNT